MLNEIRNAVQNNNFNAALSQINDLEKPISGEIAYYKSLCLDKTCNELEAADSYLEILTYQAGITEEFALRYQSILVNFLARMGRYAEAMKIVEAILAVEPENQQAKTEMEELNPFLPFEPRSFELNTPLFVSTVPRSGTHLVRNLFAAIFGSRNVLPSSQYNHLLTYPELLDRDTFENKVHIGHLHWTPELSRKLADYPVITVMRDPRAVTTSYVHHWEKQAKSKQNDWFTNTYREIETWDDKLATILFGLYNPDGMGSLQGTYTSFVNHSLNWVIHNNAQIIRYEEILTDLKTEHSFLLRKAIKACEIHCEDQALFKQRMALGSNPSLSRTFRLGNPNAWASEYTNEAVELSKVIMGGLLQNLGYEIQPDWDQENFSDSDRHSQIHSIRIEQYENFNLEGLLIKYQNNAYMKYLINGWAISSFPNNFSSEQKVEILNYLLDYSPGHKRWTLLLTQIN